MNPVDTLISPVVPDDELVLGTAPVARTFPENVPVKFAFKLKLPVIVYYKILGKII